MLPLAARAMSQCPPEFGEKSAAFVALGIATLLLGFIAGGWAAWAIVRRARHPWSRRGLAWVLAGIVTATIWLVTVLVVFGVFVLPC